MDRYEYRSQHGENQATGAGIALTAAGGLNEWAASAEHIDAMGQMQHASVAAMQSLHLQAAADVFAALPGGSACIVAGVSGIAAAQAHRRYRTTHTAYLRRMLHHKQGWQTLNDFRRYSGAMAARNEGAKTRHRMSWWERQTAPASEFGMVLGRTVTGPWYRRHHQVVSSWQHGVLVLGEPGSRKSGLLANTVLDFPGPSVVVSTKMEFWTHCHELRQHSRGPVRLFAPRTPVEDVPDQMLYSWDMVEGCRDAATAERRAEDLMAAATGGGLQNSDFWASKGRALFKALLAAADFDQVSLREVAQWLQTEDYSRPLKVLQYHADELEPTMISGLQQYAQSSAQVTASSAAHTAAQVVEFLSDPKVAKALAPPRGTGLDMREFLESNGTLFIVTDDAASMGPVVNALVKHVSWTLRQSVAGGTVSHDPPLGVIVDEAHLTMPSVKLHDMAAALRGDGVWMAVAAQNKAQLVEKWGQEAAHTLTVCLQTTVITATHDQADRERWSARMSTRKQVEVSHSISDSSGGSNDSGGWFSSGSSGTSTNFQTHRVPVYPPEMFMDLRPEQAVVIPNQGRPSVVKFQHGLGRAAELLEKLRARQVAGETVQAERERRAREAGEAAPAEGGETTA